MEMNTPLKLHFSILREYNLIKLSKFSRDPSSGLFYLVCAIGSIYCGQYIRLSYLKVIFLFGFLASMLKSVGMKR